MDKAKQYELFGSDSEESDDGAEEVRTGEVGAAASDEDGVVEDDALGAGDLFGSEEEEEDEGASAPRANSAAPVAFSLPSMPRPSDDAKLHLVRMPNILAFQPRPFDPETFEAEETENVVRWRLSQETGERQSNARIVTWSDGSMTMHVGNEVLLAQQVPIPEGATHLYTRHKGSHLECHGVLKHKMTLAPASRASKTHQALTHKIARNYTTSKSIQVIATTEDPERVQRERDRDYEDKKRLMARQASHRARADGYAGSGPLTADFLDAADEDELDGNLGAIKAQYKNRKRGVPLRSGGRNVRRRPGATKRRSSYADDEDDDDEDDDDEDDEDEEEADGDPSEMDGFIVGDEDEEESEESDDAEEAPQPKRKGGTRHGKMASMFDEDSD